MILSWQRAKCCQKIHDHLLEQQQVWNKIPCLCRNIHNSSTDFASFQITAESDTVQRWCRNLEKTPQEYLSLACQAVENLSSVRDSDGKDLKEDIFEIQDDHLVWKQYFPEKKVYGRRGKFTLEKVGKFWIHFTFMYCL